MQQLRQSGIIPCLGLLVGCYLLCLGEYLDQRRSVGHVWKSSTLINLQRYVRIQKSTDLLFDFQVDTIATLPWCLNGSNQVR